MGGAYRRDLERFDVVAGDHGVGTCAIAACDIIVNQNGKT